MEYTKIRAIIQKEYDSQPIKEKVPTVEEVEQELNLKKDGKIY